MVVRSIIGGSLLFSGILRQALFLSLWALPALTTALVTTDVVQAAEYKIGVLAYRGGLKAIDRWQPTADYLNKSLPANTFTIVPLTIAKLRSAVERGELDFVVTNTGQYVELEIFFGVSRIATVQKLVRGKPQTQFGAVIFTKASRDDIQTISDLSGKIFIAVNKKAFGGFQMAWREMLANGVDPFKDLAELRYSGFPQDSVVYAVRAGSVDAGTVRSDLLERMEKEGKINLAEYKILGYREEINYPMLLSTQLYPEWPFAKLKHTELKISELLASVLMAMPSNSDAARAANIVGWTIPVNYQPVHELMMGLKVGPYADSTEISIEMFFHQYWEWMVAIGCVLFLLCVALVILLSINDKRKKAEMDLRQHQDHLVELVHTRTADVVAMRDKAIAASEAKSAFLSKMSHELRTPLNAIIGYSELLMDDVNDTLKKDSFIKDLKKIKLSGHHLLSIIKEILDITRIDDVKAKLNLESFSISKLLKEVLTVVESIAVENDNQLIINNSLNSSTIESDRFRLQEVLTQVLKNACKYTEHGKIILDLTSEFKNNKEWLVFVVTDTGIGMTQSQQQNVFDSFVQGDDSTSRRFDGMGLGLAISRGYCNVMGGEISFVSDVGKGTVFTVRIPTVIKRKMVHTGAA